jgi:hypothetical protein
MPWVWPAWSGKLNRTKREKEQYIFYMGWLHKLSCNHRCILGNKQFSLTLTGTPGINAGRQLLSASGHKPRLQGGPNFLSQVLFMSGLSNQVSQWLPAKRKRTSPRRSARRVAKLPPKLFQRPFGKRCRELPNSHRSGRIPLPARMKR